MPNTKTVSAKKIQTKSTKGTKRPSRSKTPALTPMELLMQEISLGPIVKAISDKHGTAYAYAKANGLTDAEVSRFLNKKCPITLKALMKHCNNLGLSLKVSVSSS